MKINKENYDKFIFKGSLALESYYDDTNENKELFDNFNNKLRKYRLLNEKTRSAKEKIVNELMTVIKAIGEDKFTIYSDGDTEYNYKIN